MRGHPASARSLSALLRITLLVPIDCGGLLANLVPAKRLERPAWSLDGEGSA
jgi:hypothetical protein